MWKPILLLMVQLNMKYDYDDATYKIIGAALEVHKELGPGLLESVHEYCLIKELNLRGLISKRQVRLPVIYKGEVLNKDFFIDILVENKIAIEIKCVEQMNPVYEIQLLTYLKLSGLHIGLLINFNVPLLKDGITRKINGYK